MLLDHEPASPLATFTPPAWMRDAACIEHPHLAWFPSPGCGARRITAAKAVCGRCLVRSECLDYALTERITAGVWGGTTPNERAQIG